MDKHRHSLKPVADDKLPLPSQELMQYGIDHDIFESQGLMMHIILGRIITLAMIKKMQASGNGDKINEEVGLALNTIYHATRQQADFGKIDKSNEEINTYMKTHDDIDFALKIAKEHEWRGKGFEKEIIQGVRNFRRNPRTRDAYFPHETLQTNGIINRTETIAQLTSRLVAGPICNIDDRFIDLKNRRSEELGKLELEYIKGHLDKGIDTSFHIAKPLLESAKTDNELTIHNESDLKSMIISGEISNERMGIRILDGHEKRYKNAINQFCEMCDISDFHSWLKSDIQVVKDEKAITSMEKEFRTFLGRDLNPNEFIPHLPGIDIIYKRLGKMREEMRAIEKIKGEGEKELTESLNETQLAAHERTLQKYRDGLKTLMINIEEVVRRLQPK